MRYRRQGLYFRCTTEADVECSENDADRAAEILSEEMTHACELKVPLIADVNRGGSWYDAKG